MPLDDLEIPEGIVDRIDVDAFVETLALPLGQAGEAVEERRRQVLRIVARVDKGPRVGGGIGERLQRHGIAFLAEQHVRPVHLARRVEVDVGPLHEAGHDLGEARQGDQRGRIGDLRGLIEEDGRIFEAEDLLDAVLVVEAADPDARSVGKFEERVAARLLQHSLGKAEPHHRRQRVERDGGARGIGVKAQDGVAGTGSLQRPLHDGANDDERLARSRAAGKTGVALRPIQKAARGILARAERDHAGILVR